MAAISREDLDTKALDKIQDLFISKWPAYLYDTSNPDWLPTLHLGHDHTTSSSVQEGSVAMSVAKFERAVERSRRRDTIDEMVQQLPTIVAELLDLAVEEECRLICLFVLNKFRLKRSTSRFQSNKVKTQLAIVLER